MESRDSKLDQVFTFLTEADSKYLNRIIKYNDGVTLYTIKDKANPNKFYFDIGNKCEQISKKSDEFALISYLNPKYMYYKSDFGESKDFRADECCAHRNVQYRAISENPYRSEEDYYYLPITEVYVLSEGAYDKNLKIYIEDKYDLDMGSFRTVDVLNMDDVVVSKSPILNVEKFDKSKGTKKNYIAIEICHISLEINNKCTLRIKKDISNIKQNKTIDNSDMRILVYNHNDNMTPTIMELERAINKNSNSRKLIYCSDTDLEDPMVKACNIDAVIIQPTENDDIQYIMDRLISKIEDDNISNLYIAICIDTKESSCKIIQDIDKDKYILQDIPPTFIYQYKSSGFSVYEGSSIRAFLYKIKMKEEN